jgi:hypothetical protein
MTCMTTTKASKTRINGLNLRLTALRAELEQPLTKRCGVAAADCINETIATVEAELARLVA